MSKSDSGRFYSSWHPCKNDGYVCLGSFNNPRMMAMCAWEAWTIQICLRVGGTCSTSGRPKPYAQLCFICRSWRWLVRQVTWAEDHCWLLQMIHSAWQFGIFWTGRHHDWPSNLRQSTSLIRPSLALPSGVCHWSPVLPVRVSEYQETVFSDLPLALFPGSHFYIETLSGVLHTWQFPLRRLDYRWQTMCNCSQGEWRVTTCM